ncbi:unnamed protein product, partial [Effrenium voratum]
LYSSGFRKFPRARSTEPYLLVYGCKAIRTAHQVAKRSTWLCAMDAPLAYTQEQEGCDRQAKRMRTSKHREVENFLTMEGNALSTKPPPAPAGQQLKVWSVQQVWQAARGEPEEARSACSCVHASAWAPAVQQALQRISTRPGYRYVSQMGISAEAADVLDKRMDAWAVDVLAKARNLAQHRRAVQISAADLALALRL